MFQSKDVIYDKENGIIKDELIFVRCAAQNMIVSKDLPEYKNAKTQELENEQILLEKKQIEENKSRMDGSGRGIMFNWGVLSGKIYKTENGSFLSRMGVLDRNFEIKNDTLITGSLIYKKIKE